MKGKRSKKKIITIAVIVVLILFIVISALVLFLPWRKLEQFPRYQGFLDSPITEITLQEGGRSVTFSDEDLIAHWTESLNNLEIRTIGFYWSYGMDGGPSTATFRAGGEEYVIWFTGEELWFSNLRNAVNHPDNFPFEETYDLAVERHGLDDPG